MTAIGQFDELYAPDSFFACLKQECHQDWHDYTHHAFVEQLGSGQLPETCFRRYLIQDYLFLIQFARAWALAAFKADDLTDIAGAARSLLAIVDVEMDLHVRFCTQWGLSETDLQSSEAETETIAYTRYVLERGMAGDLLDLYVALAPCMIGYAEIGMRLRGEAAGELSGNPYGAWIEMYSDEEYVGVARDAVAALDSLAERRGGHHRLASLVRNFGQATRLEEAFWQMGLGQDSAR